jgi:signal transduction histidine kinase
VPWRSLLDVGVRVKLIALLVALAVVVAGVAWRVRLNAPVRVKLAALIFALVVIAGVVLLAVIHALLIHAITNGQVEVKGPQAVIRVVGGLPGSLVRSRSARTKGGTLAGPVNPPLTFKQLPKTVAALADFRAVVEASLVNLSVAVSAFALGLIAVLSALAAWYVAGRALTPLKAVTATARRLSHATLHERIRMEGPQDEIKDLADTFDDMLRRLDSAFQSQRNFMANVSHELRTPLALERTVVDVALADQAASAAELREVLAEVAQAVGEQERLIESLMVLAVSERGLARRETVDLGEVIARVVDEVKQDPAAAALSVSASLVPASVSGDPALLARMFANVAENAARHNVPGGWLAVSMAVDASRARTTVRNSGPIIPPEAVEALFEPFRRLTGERTGHGSGRGLGLSIARAVALAHDGTIAARALPEGGLEVTIELPLVDPRKRS